MSSSVPVYRGNLYSPTADPYPVYAELRSLGPVVRLKRHRAFALTGYEECKQTLLDPWESLCSERCLPPTCPDDARSSEAIALSLGREGRARARADRRRQERWGVGGGTPCGEIATTSAGSSSVFARFRPEN